MRDDTRTAIGWHAWPWVEEFPKRKKDLANRVTRRAMRAELREQLGTCREEEGLEAE